MKKLVSQLFTFTGIVMIVLFVIAFGLNKYIAHKSKDNDFKCKELPLSRMKEFTFDSKGWIYCALQGFSRIQVYGPDGDFKYNWYIGSGSDGFRILMDNDTLKVYSKAENKEFSFSLAGLLVNTKGIDKNGMDQIFKNADKKNLETQKFKDNVYDLEYSFMIPTIKKDGYLFISVPRWKYFFVDFDLTWRLGILGCFLLFLSALFMGRLYY